MTSPFDAQWNSILESSMFAEGALLSVDGGEPIPVRGVYISGTFEESSSASYAPATYVEKDFFKMSCMQIERKVQKPWNEVLRGAEVLLLERGLKFRVYDVIGKNQGDVELLMQEVSDG